ncbi:MAG: BON domain-containing protein [Burkholderiaceae bacterium]
MISDSQLKQRVLDELSWDTRVDEAHIGVTTSDGAVTLTGRVNNYPEKYAAVDAAKHVHGVSVVADEIDVCLSELYRCDDSTIAQHISHVLHCNVSIPDSDLKAKVDNGFVTLTGEVDWQHQREHVAQQVCHVSGIKGLANLITLKVRPTPENVKEKIEDALARNSEEEARNIKVSVTGETVTLDGTVKSLYERDLVENAVWKAPGVRYLIDCIRIS